MTNVYLCEKELQAEDVASAMGEYSVGHGYFRVGAQNIITYAKGHLMEMGKPDDYDPQYKRWKLHDLPISPETWIKKLKSSAREQFNIVKRLIENEASVLYIATDMDREGDSIAYDILERCDIRIPVKRIPVKSLDEASLREALANPQEYILENNSAKSADARRKADWLVGMNLTRLYTLLAQQLGGGETYHVGRVTVPMVSLVNDRCARIRNHVPEAYHTLKVEVKTADGTFWAKWLPGENYCNDKKRCVDRLHRDSVARSVRHEIAQVVLYESKERSESAPLPFDLTTLQQLACERWNYTAKEVSKGLQNLYQHHKVISYPRSENRFLPSSFIALTDDILNAISLSGPHGKSIVRGVINHKIGDARVFDDNKVDDVHHAIVPTRKAVPLERLNTLECRLYQLVCRYFVAQFYPKYAYDYSEVEIRAGDELFRATGNKPITKGWKAVLGNNLTLIEDSNLSTHDGVHPIPYMCFGDAVSLINLKSEDHATKPPDFFTESTLIKAMKKIGKYVEDEELRKALDNTAGLGTPATRADIIQTAVDRGYLSRETHKKRIMDTQKGRDLIAILPEQITSAGTTATWEMRLEQIASGQVDGDKFTQEISDWIEGIVYSTKQAVG